MPRHFLDIAQLALTDAEKILRTGHALKKNRRMRKDLTGKSIGLIFEKPSTRTRVSFEVGIHELGGHALSLTGKEMQLGHGESLGDTARVLGRFVHAIMVRTFAHKNLMDLAEHAPIPVINGLTNFSHPCQVMADVMTAQERFGQLKGLEVAWVGDGDNNVLNSWMEAVSLFGMNLRIASPKELTPHHALIERCRQSASVKMAQSPDEAVAGADIVLTDTWTSMHNEDAERRRSLLASYQIDAARMKRAKANAIFMHCLPAHRGEEVTDDVIDGAQSAVWDEAENRLHIQKAILLWCFGKI